MKTRREPKAAIYVEERHKYQVDLDAIPYVKWQAANGSIRVEIPYDGALLKENGADALVYHLGKLQVTRPQTSETEALPIEIEGGTAWERRIKSGQKGVCEAAYTITEPADTLLSIDGVVLDDALDKTSTSLAEGIFGNIDAFHNPLALRLSLWVPDLLAQTRPGELYELETMLLRRENTQQIFIPGVTALNFEQRLAENLAALANTAGGDILLGADKHGSVTGVGDDSETRKHIARALLRAALRNTPTVSLWRVTYIKHPIGATLVRVEVPPAHTRAVHLLDGVLYKRQGKSNVVEQERPSTPAQVALSPLPDSHFEDIFSRDEAGGIVFKNRDDVAVCNGNEGLKNLRLGAYICGLINAGKRTGRIIITDLPQPRRGRFNTLYPPEDLDNVLKQEMARIVPQLDIPYVERRHMGEQQVVIVHLPAWQLPVALYDGDGYGWQNLSLRELKVEDLLEKYLELTGSRVTIYDDQDVYLDQAMVYWPIRPPERLDKQAGHEGEEGLFYDVEYQAQVWEPRSFKRDEDTVGFARQLTIPLRHASLTITNEGSVVTKSPIAQGVIRIRLNDVLVSGLEVTPQANADNSWLNAIPVFKRTYLELNITARLNELFKRRTKTSLLRFLVPGVMLDEERVADLAQVCADVGFRVYDHNLFDTSPTAVKAVIQGIRSRNFYDISLQIGLACERSELTRELRYDGWRDSKATYTAMLDIRVKLWGTGRNVEKEIGRLHVQLYQTINQRLQFLRAE